jgi:hypothetical protein
MCNRIQVCHLSFRIIGYLIPIPISDQPLFLKCNNLKQWWRALPLEEVRLKLLNFRAVLKMLHEICLLLNDNKLKTVSILWNWWHERISNMSFMPCCIVQICYVHDAVWCDYLLIATRNVMRRRAGASGVRAETTLRSGELCVYFCTMVSSRWYGMGSGDL